MQQFNYDLWSQNPDKWEVKTRDGCEVTQVTRFNIDSKFPIAGVIDKDLEYFTLAGKFRIDEEDPCDLFMTPKQVQKSGWVALCKSDEIQKGRVAWCSNVYRTKEDIEKNVLMTEVIATIQIHWQEPA